MGKIPSEREPLQPVSSGKAPSRSDEVRVEQQNEFAFPKILYAEDLVQPMRNFLRAVDYDAIKISGVCAVCGIRLTSINKNEQEFFIEDLDGWKREDGKHMLTSEVHPSLTEGHYSPDLLLCQNGIRVLMRITDSSYPCARLVIMR